MRIIKIPVHDQWEQNYKKEEFINRVIKQILTICKFDKNFNIDDKTNRIDEDIKNTQTKIKSKDQLLLKSDEMRKTLVEKITDLENENCKIKMNLLESLGSVD